MHALLLALFGGDDPERVRKFFFSSQLVVGALILVGLGFLNRKKSDSFFGKRESEMKKPTSPGKSSPALPHHDLANASMKKKSEPLRLEGIRLGGPAHEVLGVKRDASEGEIQDAYRNLMKRYHPDKVGRPGSREWSDAQKIAEALNHARTEMLSVRKK